MSRQEDVARQCQCQCQAYAPYGQIPLAAPCAQPGKGESVGPLVVGCATKAKSRRANTQKAKTAFHPL